MSRFGGSTTAEQVGEVLGANAQGKTILITGGNSGVGQEAARVLAKYGAKVLLACRSEQRATKAIEQIKKSVPNADVTFFHLDLADQTQIRAAAEAYVNSGQPLHILINNAGIMACPRSLTKDGYESQFGVNHLGHFTLTNCLLPALKRSTPARIINVSSAANYVFANPQGIFFDDIDGSKSYSPVERYGQSKLANILHAKQLQRQFDAEGVDIIAVSLHPGNIPGTNLSQTSSLKGILSMLTYSRVFSTVFAEGFKSVPQGAATTVFTALANPGDLVKGGYYNDCQLHTARLNPLANDATLAQKLWELSEQLTKQA